MTYIAENRGCNAKIIPNKPRSNHEFDAITPELHRSFNSFKKSARDPFRAVPSSLGQLA